MCFALALLSSCAASCKSGKECQELGCFRSGVEVHVSPAMAKLSDAKLVAAFDGESVTCAFPLEHGDQCPVPNKYPKKLHVQLVRGDAVAREQTFDLQYTTEYPNGEHCPTKCVVASIALDW